MLGGARIVATARSGVGPTVLAALLTLAQVPPTGSPPAPPSAAVAKTAAEEFKSIKTVPWEYSPYKIRIWLTAAPAPELGDELVAALRRDLEQRLEARIGAPWSATVAAPPLSARQTAASCPQLLNEATILAADKSLLKDDKLIIVSLSATPRSCEVWAREIDWHARTWGPPVSREVRQPMALLDNVYDAVVAAFGPLARIEDGQGKTCVVRGRAAGLVTSLESPVLIARGDILQPIFRQNDRFGEPMPGKTEALPFTFLQMTSADPLSPSLFNCNVHSGMRSPIRGKSIFTSRRERWALKVRPLAGTTTLFVESKPLKRTDPKLPLSGIEVYAKTPEPELPKELTEEERKAAEKKNPPEFLGVTDWRGALTMPPGGPTLRLIYLKNGGLLLARLPIVPGLRERLTAEIPDDNPRLQAEGFVRGMNSEVTDLVVQRQLIAVRMRKKFAEGKLDEAEKLFEEFRSLKTLNDLQQMLNLQLQRQKPSSNLAVKQKIEKLYGDERELLAKYIDAELQVKLLAELSQARANPPPPPTVEDTPASKSQREFDNPEAAKEDEKKSALPSALKSKGGTTPGANPSSPAAPSPESPPASGPAAPPTPNS